MANTFKNYNYDTYCYFDPFPEARGAKSRMASAVGQDGGFSPGGLFQESDLLLTGFLGGDKLGTISITGLMKTFRANHNPGAPGTLHLDWHDDDFNDHFYFAEAMSVRFPTDNPPLVGATRFEIEFARCDPFAYSLPKKGPIAVATTGWTDIPTGGSVYAVPELMLVISPGPVGGTITFTHDGGDFYILPTQSGTIYADSRTGEVTREGSPFYGWDGILPRLNPGGTRVRTSANGASSVILGSIEWYDRD